MEYFQTGYMIKDRQEWASEKPSKRNFASMRADEYAGLSDAVGQSANGRLCRVVIEIDRS